MGLGLGLLVKERSEQEAKVFGNLSEARGEVETKRASEL